MLQTAKVGQSVSALVTYNAHVTVDVSPEPCVCVCVCVTDRSTVASRSFPFLAFGGAWNGHHSPQMLFNPVRADIS